MFWSQDWPRKGPRTWGKIPYNGIPSFLLWEDVDLKKQLNKIEKNIYLWFSVATGEHWILCCIYIFWNKPSSLFQILGKKHNWIFALNFKDHCSNSIHVFLGLQSKIIFTDFCIFWCQLLLIKTLDTVWTWLETSCLFDFLLHTAPQEGIGIDPWLNAINIVALAANFKFSFLLVP